VPPGAGSVIGVDRLRTWVVDSYVVAVVRRFFQLELLERSFGLAAQAFVALLPLVIAVVSVFVSDSGALIATQISERYGLDQLARTAIESLFSATSDVVTVSWLALVMAALSAFSLSRRLARTYAAIFEVAPLRPNQTWRGLVWIVLQLGLFIATSTLRDIYRTQGGLVGAAALIGLLGTWFFVDWFGVRLLVPNVANRLVIASAVVSGIGRLGVAVWSAFYMPSALSEQAAQYGPIGVTFAIFTYLLVNVVVYVGAPVLVTTWIGWRARRSAGATPR
jgi:membrane protein